MNILVTGAGGAIGSRLCRRLLERGDRVRGLFMPGEPASGLEEAGVEVVRGDITVPSTLEGIAEGMDTAFHLAGRVLDFGSMRLFREVMTDGTANVLARCAGKVSRFVYASSIAAYGTTRHMKGITEDEPRLWTGIPYNDTKIECEDLVVGYCFGTSTDYTIIRPANVLGPGSIWIRDVAAAFLKPTGVPLLDGGKHSASFIHVENLVDGMLLAAGSEAARNRAYHFRDDWSVTWKEYLVEVGNMLGRKPGLPVPTRLVYVVGRLLEAAYLPFFPARPPLTRNAAVLMGSDNDIDCARARGELGWETRVTYEEAMQEIAAYVAEEYPEARAAVTQSRA